MIQKILHMHETWEVGYPIETVILKASTAHLPGHEIESLLKGDVSKCGSKLSVVKDSKITFFVINKELQTSKTIKALLEYAKEKGCHEVELSFGGPVIEGLETFSY